MNKRFKKTLVCSIAFIMVFAVYSTAFAASYNTFTDYSLRSDHTFSMISEYQHAQHSPYYTNETASHESGRTSNGKHKAIFELNTKNTGFKTIVSGGYYMWPKRECQTAKLYIINDYARGYYLTISGGYALA